jgi:transcriptional regulator of met regulon
VKDERSDLDKHAEADAAGVVSHTSQGQPIPADARVAMARRSEVHDFAKARAQTLAANDDPQPIPPAA